MRYLKPFLLVMIIPLLMGFGTREIAFTKGLKKGSLAPEIKIQGIDLTNSDKYVLVQFWAVYDGESRKQNALLSNEISKSVPDVLQFASICFDKKKSVFEQAVKADKLDLSCQFSDTMGENSGIYSDYKLKRGFGNVLLDPEGVIIAKNVTSSQQVVKILMDRGVL